MLTRALGATGLEVSVLGLGAGALGHPALAEADVDRLVAGAVELGLTLVDTAPSYGLSEVRLGRALAGRRQRVVLSTKCGYGVPGVADWTPECISRGIDLALGRLRTDYWERLRELDLDPGGLDWAAFALRFAAFATGVASCLVGTSRLEALRALARAVDEGPLPPAAVDAARGKWRRVATGWSGLI